MAYNKISNKTQQKDINYLNKDFNSFRNQLINFAQTYYPNTFNDFSDGSPGMMFMETAAYIGDVLSYYTDTQLQETFLDTAQERTNLYHLAYTLGYKPQVTSVSSTILDVFQLLPSKGGSGNKTPDFNYALELDVPSTFTTNRGVNFNILNSINFNYSSSFDPTNISVYSVDIANDPEYYLLKKSAQVISSERVSQTFEINGLERFLTLNLRDSNIISIESITDIDGNEYTEVPYLAQSTVFDEVENIQGNTPTLYEYRTETPYLLKLKKVPRRFATRFNEEGVLEISFGGGSGDIVDEEVLPNPDNIGLGNRDGRTKLDSAFDPSNFLYSKAYGQVPSNTVLTVTYLKGGGLRSNVATNTITNLSSLTIKNKPNLNQSLLSTIKESLACTNEEPASGGTNGDSLEDIRQNTIANFAAQQRVITKEDYMVRTLAMPARYGRISKVYINKDSDLNNSLNLSTQPNALSTNLYVLGFNSAKKLVTCNTATKTNLATYLNEFKPLTDSINIKNAFVINFKIDFEITTFKNTNNERILLECISELQDYFNIDRWQINQPIIISEVINVIANVKGVQSVQKIIIDNISGIELGYSQYKYDFKIATNENIIFPSMDPCIFELKYPNNDIRGKITQY